MSDILKHDIYFSSFLCRILLQKTMGKKGMAEEEEEEKGAI